MTFRAIKLGKFRNPLLVLLAILLVAGGSSVIAHDAKPQPVEGQLHSQTVTNQPKTEPKASSDSQPATKVETNGPCTATTTSDVDNTPPDTHNNTTTNTECHSSTSSSSNSVNISNSNSQTSVSSGSVSNTNTNSTYVNQ